jgi:hypothetical protein
MKKNWDKKYYKVVKAYMDNQMWHIDYRLAEKYKDDPIGWARSHFDLISDCVHRGDYEAAQATKDAIIDFLNKLGLEIPDDAVLKLPEYNPVKIRALICFGKKYDPSGFSNGSAELFYE